MRKPATLLPLISLLAVLHGPLAQEARAAQDPGATGPLQYDSSQKDPSQQESSRSQRQSEPETTLRVDVNLVNVFVTVTDARGAPIGGLKKENFVLKEDDREQKIAVFDKESALPL